jgi:hypothetical protein
MSRALFDITGCARCYIRPPFSAWLVTAATRGLGRSTSPPSALGSETMLIVWHVHRAHSFVQD